MQKETPAQKKTVENVMHDYKSGDLTSGSGDRVKSRKQAIAIAMHEADIPKENDKKKRHQD
ncbi:hypothetical protein AEAC466_08685 [Asticcacaulis sp. AC466]|uniref:DUF6496 domain-containing protein n=1 Tax=Asticcacaulis sp. AC466 TaxID=1282362 RepID=UPI0003C408AB|nr:DUF6496 domain-containing protein [Asticcacaulis sp. AC466]ESQ84419.1 hypothetical protein AEAC466_08685 [Asticcacaulis sp. AC466]